MARVLDKCAYVQKLTRLPTFHTVLPLPTPLPPFVVGDDYEATVRRRRKRPTSIQCDVTTGEDYG